MSQVRVWISPLVFERLCNVEDLSAGKLFGLIEKGNPTIFALSLSDVQKCSSEENGKCRSSDAYKYDILQNLPGNIDLLGYFVACSGDNKSNDKEESLKSELKDTHMLLKVDPKKQAATVLLKKDNQYQKVEYEVLDEEFLKDYVLLHLVGKISFCCNFDYNSVEESLSSLTNKVKEGVAFQLKDTLTYILESGASSLDGRDKATVCDLVAIAGGDSESKKCSSNRILSFIMFLKSYSESSTSEIAPVIKYVKKIFKCAEINLCIDALSVVNKSMKISELHEILRESALRNLKLNETCLLKQFKQSDGNNISVPQIYHFFPRKCGHFISIAYPKKVKDEELESFREIFHRILLLPMDMPCFRRANIFSLVSTDENSKKVLINPHEGLSPSGIVDGEVSLVQGLYGYHHYMQDGFDDNGWGCAYRSLQTIFSWFRHQGYTGIPVPTHKEIQKCLVDIGDKPSSFIGSRNWIGSTEVSFVLNTLLGVSSRIVSVSSGEEMSMKGGELVHHFKTQGTPIMIGGGVLAHTIIGVDYNKKTGGLKFLILDPHYTGGEDLNVIQNKGWCGWKGLDFWKKNAFYNMCLPLRPKSI